MHHDTETRRKRLRYRASHTGTKETDLLFGGFVDVHVDSLSDPHLAQLEAMLDQAKDLDLLDWILGRVAVPEAFDNETLALIRRHAAERHKH